MATQKFVLNMDRLFAVERLFDNVLFEGIYATKDQERVQRNLRLLEIDTFEDCSEPNFIDISSFNMYLILTAKKDGEFTQFGFTGEATLASVKELTEGWSKEVTDFLLEKGRFTD
jgi:hypothetical protein